MSEREDGSDGVPNVYKHTLVAARGSADSRADTIRSSLNAASLALMGGAWISTRADAWGAELDQQRSRLQRVAGAERDEIDDEVARQPDEVPPQSWRANFAKLSHNLLP